jgi:hypothetical protein
MKRIFLAAGLLTLINPAFAQHKNGQEYDKSVFRGFSAKSNREAIKETNKNAMAAFPQWGITVDKANGNIKDIYGPAMTLPGNTLEQKAQSCVHNQLSKLNVKGGEWVIQKTTQNEVGGYVTYHQNIDGHKVAFSKMKFNFTTDGRLKRLQMSNYGTPQNYTSPVLTAGEAQTAAQQEMNGAVVTSNIVNNDWVWFPVPTENGYDLHPSYAFNIIGTDVNKEAMLLRGYVDGITGEVLYRVNDVKFDYDVTVKGTVKPDGFASTPTLLPLANLKITVNSTNYYTDALGFYSNNTINVPQNTIFTLAGKWSVVKDVPSSVTAPTQSQIIPTLGTTYEYQPFGDIEQRHLTAYYHVNVVHDFMKSKYPVGFNDMDIALPTNVDVAGSCNAFYNGTSINFYAEGSGCNSFAEIHDIIYHEYGHGINDKYYDWVSGNSMENGALNEAYADMWGMGITNNPILGANSFQSGGFIRRYDVAPKVYPADIVDEVHADGEIIAGAWWDVRENINDMAITSDIFAKSLNGTPDGPNGTEGEVYHEALISALEADDDNSNINDGTPHFLEIVTAFAEHGIYLLSDAELDHTESINLPDENTNNGLNTTLQITYQPFLKDVLMRYRVRPSATWSDIIMTETSPLQFEAQIPGQAAGSIVDYFFVVRDTLQLENAFAPMAYNPLLPALKNNIPYQYGTQLHKNIEENFENTLTDWTVGNYNGGVGAFTIDLATAGKWIQAVPMPSMANGQPSQTGADHTSGTGKCLVTGNATAPNAGVGAADVDGGFTTVVTPLFDISSYDEPIVEYYRWYSNNRGSNAGSETWNVRIGTPTSSAWFSVDNTSTSDQSWRRRIFKVKDYLPAATEIRLVFRAEDKTTNGGAAVEAAVDDFMIYSKGWPSSVGAVSAPQKAEIYPNPANEMVNIKLAGSGYAKGSIGIYDVTGKKVTETAIAKGKVSYSLGTGNLAAGTYFLIIQSEKAIQSQKFTVAH